MASENVRFASSSQALDNVTATTAIDIDRLSNLPIDVLYYIFSYIDAVDVVRSCVLSKTWKQFWTEVPYLNFDSLKFRYDDKFWRFFLQMLVLREGSSIKRLRIGFENVCEYQLQGLVSLASSKKVQELDIDALQHPHPFNPSYNVPLELLRPLCESLEILKLAVPGFVKLGTLTCLSHLKVLRLEGFEFLDDIFVQTLLPNSKLEEVYIVGCRMDKVERLNIAGCNLKNFEFINDQGGNSFKGKLTVSAPNLVNFHYVGITIAGYSMSSLTSLRKAFLKFREFEVKDDHVAAMPALINALENAHVLTLSAILVRSLYPPSGDIAASALIPLHKLKRLKIELGCNSHDMGKFIKFLKLAPGIETLSIFLEKSFGKKEIWTPPDENLICLSHHLKVIEIANVNVGFVSLALIKFLLQKGEVLCSMHLMHRGKMLEYAFQKISAFYKASAVVSISFAKANNAF